MLRNPIRLAFSVTHAFMRSLNFALALCAVAVSSNNIEFQPTTLTAPLLEQFHDVLWTERWIVSEAKKQDAEGKLSEDELRYRGVFEVEEASVWPAIPGDKGLVMKTASAHHAISHVFENPIDPTGKDLVVQYEVKFQKEHECGGAYIKLLTFDSAFNPKEFQNAAPYTIMFGPDKCGFDNKVHFIFRHKNPVNGEIEEKHLTPRPEGKFTKATSLYTLIVKPDNTFQVLVNNEVVKSGSLLEDFTPSVNPPKEIEDPSDSKPADWVDQAKIADPTATKPEEWDEEALREIVDPEATKPQGWLDNEPSMVSDSEVAKPDDWNDEEDGDWTSPLVPNPKCEAVGCGKWTAPTIPNPNYKGKWSAPLIENPDYKGPWKARVMPNPDYFEDKHPSNFDKIGAVGFELWTVQSDVLFDNVYIGHSVEDAAKLAKETWAIKKELEQKYEAEAKKEAEEAQAKKAETEGDTSDSILDKLRAYAIRFQKQFHLFVDAFKKSPLEAIKNFPEVVGIIVSLILLTLPLLLTFGGSGTMKQKTEKKKEKVVVAKEEEEEEEVVEKEEEEEEKPSPKSKSRKTKTSKAE